MGLGAIAMSDDVWELGKPLNYSTKEWEMFQQLTPTHVEEKLISEGWTRSQDLPEWLKGKDIACLVKESGQELLVVRERHLDWPGRMIELVEHFAQCRDVSRLEALAFLTGRKVLIVEGERR